MATEYVAVAITTMNALTSEFQLGISLEITNTHYYYVTK